MCLRIHGICNVDDLAIATDQETNPLGHRHDRHLDIVSGNNLAIGIADQREIQIVLLSKLFVAFHRVVTDADDLDIFRLQIAHAVAQSASFFGAAPGEILRIKIEQHGLFADVVCEVENIAVLILTGEERCGVAGFRDGGKGWKRKHG